MAAKVLHRRLSLGAIGLAMGLLFAVGCRDGVDGRPLPSARSAPPAPTSAAVGQPPSEQPATTGTAAAATTAPRPAAAPLDTAPYPWHDDPSIEPLEAVATLEQRFAPPAGFTRVDLEPDSFGAWLRRIPLTKPDTPVLSYDGRVILPSGHRNLAAVTTLDTGKRDLQQCADAIMRLHAEWLWHRGRAAEASYPTGAGPIPWSRYLAGAYPRAKGNTFEWGQGRARSNSHKTYRAYSDVVASWANTVSLARTASKPDRAEVRPGDFFILPGGPGHTVLILDLAKSAAGRQLALLGQSFMPAQNFQVLRPSRDGPWFELDPEHGVDTPFWERFPWSSLRRLD